MPEASNISKEKNTSITSLEDDSILDTHYMEMCIKNAKTDSAVGKNPFVGCVIISENGKLIAKGEHHKWGGPHAEAIAINNALSSNTIQPLLPNSTLYVSLEPCSHHGKTPPCTDAIIKSGIRKVVIGSLDPSDKVEGIKELEDAGIAVTVMKDQHIAKYLNRGFYKQTKYGLPWVVAKVAITIDGKIALFSGESKWITNHKSRELVHSLRSKCGVIVTGSGTVERDNPNFDIRLIEKESSATMKQPDLYIMSQSGYSLKNDANVLKAENRHVEVSGREINEDLLRYISDRSNTNYIMLESGPKLLSSFLKAGLIDELQVFQAPFIMGEGISMVEGLKMNSMDEKDEWLLTSIIDLLNDSLNVYIRPKYEEFLLGHSSL
jgi:diaminohydroxyphosphoribosylaminopyrimidine deaminase/5-amino-6-(5-phosphoribosylamino)uracil reductase